MMRSCPECGAIFGKPRSVADHRRFFGLIGKAFHQWPSAHPFQPSSAEQLRAYLLVEAQYHDATPVFVELDCFPEDAKGSALKLVSLAVEASIAAALSQGSYAFTRVVGDTITVLKPKSINFHSLAQKEFAPLREKIEEIIETTIGVTADQLLREEAA